MELPSTKVSWFEHLVDQISTRSSIRLIYGDPIERQGVTVIPVGKVSYGMGGGSNIEKETEKEENESKSNMGGGGGATVRPTGYIEIKNGRARFRRIVDTTGLVSLVVGFGFSYWLGLRGLRALSLA